MTLCVKLHKCKQKNWCSPANNSETPDIFRPLREIEVKGRSVFAVTEHIAAVVSHNPLPDGRGRAAGRGLPALV